MRITLAAVGRARNGPARALYDVYRQRLAWPLTLKEIEEKAQLPLDARLARQGKMLLAAVPRGARVVVMDEGGKALSSEGFAHCLDAWRVAGTSAVAFLIGGADGHAPSVKAQADLVLSFGRMTWPHLLVRALVAEQLYRAETILKGHPYHRS